MQVVKKEEKRVLIIGAGIAGQLLASDLKRHHPECRLVGFVDDVPKKRVTILGPIDDLPKILREYDINEMVIAIPSADGSLVRRILLKNMGSAIPIRIVPRDQRIIRTCVVLYRETREIEPEDFLGRPFVWKGVALLQKFYRNKTVFITGGAGSIGSEVVRQLLDLNVKQVVVYDHSEYLLFLLEQQLKERKQLDRCQLIVGSILHNNKLNRLFAHLHPDIVFHAAAYKHVHLMQDNIDEAVYNNCTGTKRVIDAAIQNSVPVFTFISTDKVVNPTSVMGATKKLCEYYIQHLRTQKLKTSFNIVRFGNVINSNGSALPLFERQMKLYRYVTVTHRNMQRFFMSIREAAQLVVESTALGKSNAIHILNMGELIRIYDVARCLIRSKNLLPETDIEIRITGLRKGEKMIEELYTSDEEKHLKRDISKRFFRLSSGGQCPVDIYETFSVLEDMVKGSTDQKILWKTMRQLFPSLKKR